MRIIKCFLKWFAWISGALMLLLAAFFLIPGIECAWRFPAEGNPWISLKRENLKKFDMRDVSLGDLKMKLIFVDSASPSPSGKRGSHWEDSLFYYVGDYWLFAIGTKELY